MKWLLFALTFGFVAGAAVLSNRGWPWNWPLIWIAGTAVGCLATKGILS